MSKDYVTITTVSTFKIRYVVPIDKLQAMNPDAEVNPIEWAKDSVTLGEVEEFSQKHLGENVIEGKCISESEMFSIFAEENDYLSIRTDEEKIKYVKNTFKGGYYAK